MRERALQPGLIPIGARRHFGTPRFINRRATFVTLPDGTGLAVDADGLYGFDRKTYALLQVIAFPDGTPGRLLTLPAGDLLFFAEGTIHVRHRVSGQVERLCAVPPGKELRFSADGTHVATLVGSTIEVTRCADGVRIAAIAHPYSSSNTAYFAVAAEGAFVLFTHGEQPQSGSGWTAYTIVPTRAGEPRSSGQAAGDDASVGLSADGRRVEFTDSWDETAPGQYPEVWWDGAEPLAVSADERLLLTPHGLFDTSSGAVRALPHGVDRTRGEQPRALLISGTMAACAFRRAALELHDLATGAVSTPELGLVRPDFVRVAASPDGSQIAFHAISRTARSLVVLSGPGLSRRTALALPPDGYPDVIAVLADGRVLLASNRQLDLCSASAWVRRAMPAESSSALEIAASDDGGIIALRTGGESVRGPVLLFSDGAAATLIDTGEGVANAARCLAVSADGARLAVGTNEGLRLWGTRPLQRQRTLPTTSFAVGLAFSRDGRTLYSSQYDTTVTAWDV